MSSTTTLVAKQYRLQEWAKQVQECNNRPDDMSMDEWCQSVGLTHRNFYYC